jgi:hypothetical protein
MNLPPLISAPFWVALPMAEKMVTVRSPGADGDDQRLRA